MSASLGLSMGNSAREPVARIGSLARRAEELGFDALWAIDSQLVMGDVYVCLATAAIATDRIELGTGVTNPKTRDLTVTANAIASLDNLSEGRAILGVGSGDSSLEPLGIKASKLGELRDFVADSKALLRGESLVGPTGKEFRIARTSTAPIFVAATQPRMLELAGAHADGVVLLGFANLEVIEWQMGYIERGLEQAGRGWNDLKVDYWATISIQEDREQARQDTSSWVAGQARWLHRWKEVPPILSGFAKQAAEAAASYEFDKHLSLRAEHGGTVTTDLLDIAAISGTLEDCVPRVRELAEHPHVDRVTLTLLSGKRERRLEGLAELAERI